MPLLDETSLAMQLRRGILCFPELKPSAAAAAAGSPPPWAVRWFATSGEALGAHLGNLCHALTSHTTLATPPTAPPAAPPAAPAAPAAAPATAALPAAAHAADVAAAHRRRRPSPLALAAAEATGSAAGAAAAGAAAAGAAAAGAAAAGMTRVAAGETPLPSSSGLLARVRLLQSSRLFGRALTLHLPYISPISPPYLPYISPASPLYLSRLFGGALTLHLAAVAARCTERRVPPGARFCRAGETYLIREGRCRKHAHGAPNRNPNRNRNPTPS